MPRKKQLNSAAPRVDVTQHVHLVAKVARNLARTLPAHVVLDDLISAGYVGLLDAATRFDPARNDNFPAFALHRIRGAMLDDLRAGDTMSRDMRDLANEIRDATEEVHAKVGRAPEDDEIARHMGIGVDDLRARQQKLSGWMVLSIDDDADGDGPSLLELTPDPASPDPYEVTARNQRLDQLAACIEQLPERMHQVLSMYYMRGMGFAKIGAAMGLTESRICQIHGQATRRLRETCVALQAHRDGIAA